MADQTDFRVTFFPETKFVGAFYAVEEFYVGGEFDGQLYSLWHHWQVWKVGAEKAKANCEKKCRWFLRQRAAGII